MRVKKSEKTFFPQAGRTALADPPAPRRFIYGASQLVPSSGNKSIRPLFPPLDKKSASPLLR